MEYHGKLYGHLGGGKYFDTSHTTDEWDAMVERITFLEAENQALRQSCVVGRSEQLACIHDVTRLRLIGANITCLDCQTTWVRAS
jgi:hypothetical protein